MENKSKNVALVLSGGGARGMAHIGVIETLIDKGYNITSIAGTSIGSLIGGVYISGNLGPFKQWVQHTGKLDILKLMDFAIHKNGFIKGERVFKEIKKYVSDQDIESLPIPYAAVAVDIKNHKEFVMTSGNLISAIRASVSVPTVLRPIEYQGIELVDGGVLNPLPLDVVFRNPGDILVAVDLNADIPYTPPNGFLREPQHNKTYDKTLAFINEKWSSFFNNEKPQRSGFFDLVTHSLYAMQMKLTQLSIEKHQPDLVVEISRVACEIFEFHRAEELIQHGKERVLESLKDL